MTCTSLHLYYGHVTWLNSRSSLPSPALGLCAVCRQLASNVAENLGRGGFLYGVYKPREWLWIDSKGKMETRHPAEGSFGNEFLSMWITAELWQPEVARRWEKLNFLHVLDKRPLTVKFSKVCSLRIHRDTDRHVVFKFRKIVGWWKSVKSCIRCALESEGNI